MLIDEAPAATDCGDACHSSGQQQRAGSVAIKTLRVTDAGRFAGGSSLHRSDSLLIAISFSSCQSRPSLARMMILAGTLIGSVDAILIMARAFALGGQERALSRSRLNGAGCR